MLTRALSQLPTLEERGNYRRVSRSFALLSDLNSDPKEPTQVPQRLSPVGGDPADRMRGVQSLLTPTVQVAKASQCRCEAPRRLATLRSWRILSRAVTLHPAVGRRNEGPIASSPSNTVQASISGICRAALRRYSHRFCPSVESSMRLSAASGLCQPSRRSTSVILVSRGSRLVAICNRRP